MELRGFHISGSCTVSGLRVLDCGGFTGLLHGRGGMVCEPGCLFRFGEYHKPGLMKILRGSLFQNALVGGGVYNALEPICFWWPQQ